MPPLAYGFAHCDIETFSNWRIVYQTKSDAVFRDPEIRRIVLRAIDVFFVPLLMITNGRYAEATLDVGCEH